MGVVKKLARLLSEKIIQPQSQELFFISQPLSISSLADSLSIALRDFSEEA